MSVDPLAAKYSSWSSYHYVADNPTLITDPTGMEWSATNMKLATGYFQGYGPQWIPAIEESDDSDGNTEGRLVLKKEEGDNAKSLADFLDIGEDQAAEILASLSDDGTVILPENIEGVEAINKAINKAISLRGEGPFGTTTPGTHDYNCWASCIAISQGRAPLFDNNHMGRFKFQELILANYTDVADSPSLYRFGHTIIRFGEDHWSIRHGSWNETTHGATYLGTSRDGTIYTWSKNGRIRAPGVFTLDALRNKYGKVEGYRAEDGGGFYNRRR